MFSFLKKHTTQIVSPMNGIFVPISEIPDPVFSQKMVGDGFGINASDDVVYSPIKGVVSAAFDTKHAVSITSDDGLEILLHIGIDTVKMQGEGFEVFVSEGDIVEVGQKVLTVDRKLVEERGYSPMCCTFVTNSSDLKELVVATDVTTVVAGETPLATYKK